MTENKAINEKSLAFRLRVARYMRHIGQTELAEKLGITYTTLSRYEQGHRVPPANLIERIAKELKVEPGWLFAGESERERYVKENFEDEGYVFIRKVAGKSSAGPGRFADNIIESRFAFKRDWIQRRGNPEHMLLIAVEGDSMNPTLQTSDFILVNCDRNKIEPNGGIYAIAIDDHIMVKRLQVLWSAKKVQVISDNPKYKTFEIEENKININGKVIWVGHEIDK